MKIIKHREIGYSSFVAKYPIEIYHVYIERLNVKVKTKFRVV